ncbi:DEAD/DEAH box helicase family protein [Halomonas vilamensis]|uniref:DEAD/DEAH box helicase family protein n=1 Tax=Vreelandella vilamensis TaxID=531309 RepID=A0ABU1H592_9GAMM|nr:DEAD/DEAH box helicase family protein [Halomonas vilamensis]MDR5899456.1 DEAD/DEAH box helicase family protein [Halomonas vilamensis]
MKPLRRWQSECIVQALAHFQNGRHFFVQATPAAGKTRLAAEIAKCLLEKGLIDFVICFAPTREVVAGIQRTFTDVLQKRFGDTIGAVGAAYTYQSMAYQSNDFWDIFNKFRILLIFDEIHHCAGHDPLLSNSWGQKILQYLQDQATYTVGLSGTPWRSDSLPVALARYSDPDERLVCDYCYDLRTAIRDGVCRAPRVTLIDNSMIQLVEEQENSSSVRLFSGVAQLLGESPVSYEDLLRHDDILNAVLDIGIHKLGKVRRVVPDAGGLVVAADIEHAHQISEILHAKGESFVVVTSKTPRAHDVIEQYRHSDICWIVAVSMISEGTDIPRLCTCLYLSRIRTELHYRQVLGRILRKIGIEDDMAWLYVIAEPVLRKFSRRIADDLPDDQATLQTKKLAEHLEKARTDHGAALISNSGGAEVEEASAIEHKKYPEKSKLLVNSDFLTLSFSNYYRQYLLSLI